MFPANFVTASHLHTNPRLCSRLHIDSRGGCISFLAAKLSHKLTGAWPRRHDIFTNPIKTAFARGYHCLIRTYILMLCFVLASGRVTPNLCLRRFVSLVVCGVWPGRAQSGAAITRPSRLLRAGVQSGAGVTSTVQLYTEGSCN